MQILIALVCSTIVVLLVLTFYSTKVTEFILFFFKGSHSLYGMQQEYHHVVITNPITSIDGPNISDDHRNSTVGHVAMNMNSSSMSSMLARGNLAMGFNQSKIIHHFLATATGGEIM
jgi:hypothetical protein